MGIPARRISGSDNPRAANLSAFTASCSKREPRRRSPAGPRDASLVARFPEGDVGGRAVHGSVERAESSSVFELDEAAAQPSSDRILGRDLEVHVGLAARLRDLAPAGADLVALSGVDPVIGRFVVCLVDRDDRERGGDVEGLEGAGEGAVVELGEGAEWMAMRCLLGLISQGPSPAMTRARETA